MFAKISAIIIVHSIVLAYDIVCPDHSQTKLRSRGLCAIKNDTKSVYTCLQDVIAATYNESCLEEEDFVRPGFMYVVKGQTTNSRCSTDRYQPVRFYKTSGSMCIFLKSRCTVIGQMVARNGSSLADTTCICDYTEGYAYVTEPGDPCNCVPSVEDCTCYFKECPENHLLSADYECIHRDATSLTKCVKIDNSEKDLTRATTTTISTDSTVFSVLKTGTHTCNFTASISIAVLLVILCVIMGYIFYTDNIPVVTFVQRIWKILNNFEIVRQHSRQQQELPTAISHLSEEDKDLYLEIIKSGTETRYYIRIIIIGEHGVGKTCLLRQLLEESIEDVKSTDGIDVVQGCKIRLKDGQYEEWIIDKATDNKRDIIARINRAINAKTFEDEQNQTDTSKEDLQTKVTDSLSPTDDKDKMEVSEPSIPGIYDNKEGKSGALSVLDNEFGKSFSESNQVQRAEKKIVTGHETLNNTILNELSQFINAIQKFEIPNEVLVDCRFWDFPGLRHYYPTHQIFLNPNAVYLLITDITKDIKQINTEGGYDQIGEYIDFWFDSIHSCRDVEDTNNHKEEYLNPPVIVVCTGIDKCKDKLNEKKEKFRKHLLSLLGREDKLKHLRRICHISNTEPAEEDLDHLRQSIFESGKTIKTFGEKLPLKWIHLERELAILCGAGMNILSWPDMAVLASKCSVENDNEVCLFLKYHHNIGNIIYFESLEDYIILNPKWLADALRCFISDKYDDDVKLTQEWKTLEDTGELKPSLIVKLLKKEPKHEFDKHEDHLLKLMEMFGIIVKFPNVIEDGQKQSLWTYYMPCMISEQTAIEQIYDVFGVKRDKCTRTPWLCIQFNFMPFDFFNHIICYYITKYPVCTEASSERKALYHGMGVFYLDHTQSRKFCLCFSKNTVAMQIWQWRELAQGKCKSMLEELQSVIHNVKDKYEPRRVYYTVKTKCADGDIHIAAGQKSCEELTDLGSKEYFCEEHNEMHDTRDFFHTWFEEYKKGLVYNAKQEQHSNLKVVRKPYKVGEFIFQLHHQFNLKSVLKSEKMNVTGGVMMDDGRLVFCLPDMFRLLICNTNGSQTDSIPVQYGPWNVTAVNNSTVAVASDATFYIEMYDINNKHKLKSIQLPGRHHIGGITAIHNKLVVLGACKIYIIDHQTKELVQTIMVEEDIDIKLGVTCVHATGDRIFYSDSNTHKLYNYSNTDDKQSTTTLPSTPVSITSLQDGSLYVACMEGSVLHVASDGKHYTSVTIQGLKTLENYSVISYNQKQRKLFTCTSNGTVLVINEK